MSWQNELKLFDNQVAGHMQDCSGNYVGLLKHNGLVFKPIIKKEYGEREVSFYKTVQSSVDSTLIELKSFIPRFYGTQKLTVNDREYDFIVMEDLTRYYKDPCIMDIKIGKRTWDPMASYEKILSEENKYQDCRRELGFCIPGFQVYSVVNNELVKYGKEFGKKLNKDRAIDAIKTFLNVDNEKFCRSLIVQFLAVLWRIQHWARNQRRLRLFSSSLLLTYDARKLREQIQSDNSRLKLSAKSYLYRPMSMAKLNICEAIPTGFSGQLTKEGPILETPTSTSKLITTEVPSMMEGNDMWQKSINTLNHTHSFQNNYDKDVQNKKQSYMLLLDKLSSEEDSECWATAKMIDFPHVYPAENSNVDLNYLHGIENLVKLFEDFLVNSE